MKSLRTVQGNVLSSAGSLSPAVEDLVFPSLQMLLASGGGLAVLVWVMLGQKAINMPLLLGATGLTVTLLLSYLLARRYPRLAGGLLLSGAMASCIITATVGRTPGILILLAPIIVAAGGLFTPRASLLWAGIAVALVLLLQPQGEGTGLYAILFAVTGVSAWAAFQPQYSLLLLAWERSAATVTLMEQLRNERGELNKTIKSLDLSYQLLEKTNRELTVARREAEILRDLRNRFATNVSHELRTPLNIVLGFASLIYRNPRLYGFTLWPDALLRDLAQIQRNARHLSQLVDDVIDLARVDALAMPVKRELTKIGPVIREAVDSIASMAEEKGLRLSFSCPEDLPEVPMDLLRVRQILYNLLSNAIRYTDRGQVSVEVKPGEAEVVISVRDTGRGIPPAELSHIFDEFYQVSRPKMGPDSGKGLGLAVAKRLVQLHGGRIWAESEMGSGSTFFFTLPLSDVTVSRLKSASFSALPRVRIPPTVVVVSQDDTAALYLSRRMEGYNFTHAGSLEQARSMINQGSAAAVVLDASLGVSVTEARTFLSENQSQSVPVVECPLPSTQWISGGNTFASVLIKPITADNLFAVLDTVLSQTDESGLASENGPRPKLLLVDDDRGFVELTKRLLQAGGRCYQVESAYDGKEAMRKMARSQPNCVLLDLVLPEMNGFEVVTAMRKDPVLSQVPVVAITAATPGEDNLAAEGGMVSLAVPDRFRPGELTALLSFIFDIASDRSAILGSDAGPGAVQPAISAW